MLRLLFFLIFFVILQTQSSVAALRVEMAQIAVRPGDFAMLLNQIITQYQQAIANGADLFVLPEGTLPGYPSNDVLTETEYIDRAEEAVEKLREFTKGKPTAIAIGHIGRNPKNTGRALQNFASVFENGQLLYRQAKVLLPTYGPFDDSRYFEPGTIDQIKIFEFRGKRISFIICEDGWFYLKDNGRLLYKHNPVLKTKRNKPDFVISLSASPYNKNKQPLREKVHLDVSRRVGVPLLYINQVGIVDGVGFDGGSFVALPDGTIQYKMASFSTDSITLDIPDSTTEPIREVGAKDHRPQPVNEPEMIIKALSNGIREYTKQNGMSSVVIELNGSVDSAVSAFLAVNALGAENVSVLKASNLNSAASAEVDTLIKNLSIPEKNIQVRSQWSGNIIQRADSRQLKILTTNKTQLATGQITGSSETHSLGVVADLFKTEIWKLADYINTRTGQIVIPSHLISQDRLNEAKNSNLPESSLLEALLQDLISGHLNQKQLRDKHTGLNVENIAQLYFNSELKRQSSQAPLLRISSTPFGIEFRKPITAKRIESIPQLDALSAGSTARRCGEAVQIK